MKRETSRFFVCVALLVLLSATATSQEPRPANRDAMAVIAHREAGAALFAWRTDGPGLARVALAGLSLEQSTIATAESVRAIAAGDIDGDGLVDLVVASGPHGGLEVSPGIESGLAAAIAVGWDLSGATIVGLADADGDGLDDLVLQRDTGRTRFWEVAISDGITLREPVSWTSTRSANVRAFSIEDADGDGLADLWLFFDPSRGRSYQLRLSDGSGFSGISEWLRAERTGLPFSTADANGDGRPDLWIESNSGRTRTWGVHANTGSAFAVSPVTTSTTTPDVEVIAASDTTGDGRADLWLEYDHRGTRRWQVREFAGSEFDSIANWHSLPLTERARAVGAGDANGDGRADLWLQIPTEDPAAGTDIIRVFFSNGSGLVTNETRELVLEPIGAQVAASEEQDDDDDDDDNDEVAQTTPPVAAPIDVYFGVGRVDGRIEETDGRYEGYLADAYELETIPDAGYRVAVSSYSRLPYRLVVFDPDGAQLESHPDYSHIYDIPPGEGGMYTLYLFSSNDDDLERYWITIQGPGTEFEGEIEVGKDRTDMGVTYDSVDLELTQYGGYRFQLTDDFPDGAMHIRDANYEDAPILRSLDASRHQIGVLEPGEYHVIIEDKAFGGPWRLIVTYLGVDK